MQTEKEREPKLEVIDLTADPVCINLEETQAPRRKFHLESVKIPSEFHQKLTPNARILDGFTKGAVKNIFNFSKSMIWLYKITQNIISLLSYTKIGDKVLRKIFSERPFQVNNKTFSEKEGTRSVQLVFEVPKTLVTLKFDTNRGKLLKTKITQLPSRLRTKGLRFLDKNANRRSRAESFVFSSEDQDSEPHFNSLSRPFGDIQRLSRNRLSLWFSLTETAWLSKRKDAKRFRDQFNMLSLKTRRLFHRNQRNLFSKQPKISTYSFNSGGNSLILICSKDNFLIFFFLVDPKRRKIHPPPRGRRAVGGNSQGWR